MVFVKPVMKNLSILKINVKMYSVLHVQCLHPFTVCHEIFHLPC